MTMQIVGRDRIGDVPILEVRDLLRRFPHVVRSDCFEKAGYSRRQAKRLVRALMTKGYLEAGPDDQLKMTPACKAFTRGSAARRVKRETAEAALDEVIDRVRQANCNEDFLMKIKTVVVYGSYLADAERLGDLDLAIELEPRYQPENFDTWNRLYMEHFEKSGRAYRRIGYECEWAQIEVFLFLKNRRRTLSLHSMQDFIEMEKTANFAYRVVLGDPDRIIAKLQTCPKNAAIVPDHDSFGNQ
jgi:hypothetical protein